MRRHVGAERATKEHHWAGLRLYTRRLHRGTERVRIEERLCVGEQGGEAGLAARPAVAAVVWDHQVGAEPVEAGGEGVVVRADLAVAVEVEEERRVRAGRRVRPDPVAEFDGRVVRRSGVAPVREGRRSARRGRMPCINGGERAGVASRDGAREEEARQRVQLRQQRLDGLRLSTGRVRVCALHRAVAPQRRWQGAEGGEDARSQQWVLGVRVGVSSTFAVYVPLAAVAELAQRGCGPPLC
mmetsp:Transcript_3550/g.11896  ORF Transcript_3550/g.11896 Transcript_3550/m.11896 type:complete len:241 (-) Transcript_3550:381-1103(-)